MTPKDLEELEKKYREYLPMPSAKRILELIEYCRKLEKQVKGDKK